MNILVTGASGFVGRHLLPALSGHRVTGTTRKEDPEKLKAFFSAADFVGLDIEDARAVEEVVRKVRPDACFHLAGVASVDEFARRPKECFRINVEGWLNVLEAFKKHAPTAAIALVSSAQVYGDVPAARLPLTEQAQVAPGNFYAISKASCEWLAGSYAQTAGMRFRILRPFNHIGPGQSVSFVCSSLAKQVAQIQAGLAEPVLHAGNLRSKRDFTDVRDIVRAYALALEKCEDGQAYNICSGKTVAVQEILDRLCSLAGVKVQVQSDPALKREADPKDFYGDSGKFRRATGWAPDISIEQTLRDTLEYWKKQIRQEGTSFHAAV